MNVKRHSTQNYASFAQNKDQLNQHIKNLLDKEESLPNNIAFFPSANDTSSDSDVSSAAQIDFYTFRSIFVIIAYSGYLALSGLILYYLIFVNPTEFTLTGILKKLFALFFIGFVPIASLYVIFRKPSTPPWSHAGLILTRDLLLISDGHKVDIVPMPSVSHHSRETKGVGKWILTLQVNTLNSAHSKKVHLVSGAYKGLRPDSLDPWLSGKIRDN